MDRRRVLVISTIAVALAGVGAWYALEPGESAVKAAAPPLPVTVAIASKGDLPIYLTGLGTVQASFTVGIRAQVDGKLEQVLFKGGLARISPGLGHLSLSNDV
jgi:membrane fusion protein, multidrug efflux system